MDWFDDFQLEELTIPLVMNLLMKENLSGSWKNNFLTIVGEIYEEAPFYGVLYIVAPSFPKFARNSRKKDFLRLRN